MTIRTTLHRTAAHGLLALLGLGLAASAVPAAQAAPAADVRLPAAAAGRVPLPTPTTVTVTADQLGPDSVLAVVSRGNFDKVDATGLRRSLEVVTPDGGRHPVWSVRLGDDGGWFVGDFSLADWRPELHTALLRVSLGQDGELAVAYDVLTGTTRMVAVPKRASAVALAPDGSGLLLTTYPTALGPGKVVTLGWDGTRLWLPALAEGTPITSPDGTTVVTPAGRYWWVVDLATRTSRRVRVVDHPGSCNPVRWADADSVVASCIGSRGSQLRAIDLDGTSVPLGIRHTVRSRRTGPPVYDDGDVRTVQGRDWYVSYSACGGGFLTRQSPSGRVRRVPSTDPDGTIGLLGTRGDRLVVSHSREDCDSRGDLSTLALLDPVTGDETDLTVLARKETWRDLVPATEVQAWRW